MSVKNWKFFGWGYFDSPGASQIAHAWVEEAPELYRTMCKRNMRAIEYEMKYLILSDRKRCKNCERKMTK